MAKLRPGTRLARIATLPHKRFVLWCSLAGALGARVNGATTLDRFGVVQLAPTARGGREWFANWQGERVVPPYAADAVDASFYNEEGKLHIHQGNAPAPPGLTRLVVLSPTHEPRLLWTNVEMTVYARRGTTTRTLD